MEKYDIVIIGAGIYGLYFANIDELKDKKKLIIEIEDESFKRASYINQARLHNGYHYPRSIETMNDAHTYFSKFNEEFSYAINNSFKNIYAIAKNDSLTTAKQFEKVCEELNIPLKKENENMFFKENMVEAAYSTLEYTFDSDKIKERLLEKLKDKNTDILYKTYIDKVEINNKKYNLLLNNNRLIETPCVINTTYASVNCINNLFDVPLLDLKYELCEVVLGNANEELQKYSFTIMDGNYFSVMPFAKGNKYSLTSVHFTPHETCYEKLPCFNCQKKNKKCTNKLLLNCNNCENKPLSKHEDMEKLYKEFLLDKFKFNYLNSIYAVKPILKCCENDDSRPTIIKKHREEPTFISCLSGKVSTIYIMKDYIINNIVKNDERELV